MNTFNASILSCILCSMAMTIAADEHELSPYQKSVEERQNPVTGVTYEAVDPESIPEREERWSDFLPIWGKEAREQGYVLPHPFGLSLVGLHQNQPFEVTSIALNYSGSEYTFKNISASNVTVSDSTANLRADVWLFPFFNMYVMAGKTDATANLNVDIDALIPNKTATACKALELPFEKDNLNPLDNNGSCLLQSSIPTALDIKGDNLGVGMTVAGGYGDFFGMLDMNYTESDLNISKEKASTTVTSTRLGWNGAFGSMGGSLWVGAMHQDIKQTLDIILPIDGLSVVVEQEASSPVNYLLGGRINFSQEWEMIIETNAGFSDRQQFMLQLSYRM